MYKTLFKLGYVPTAGTFKKLDQVVVENSGVFTHYQNKVATVVTAESLPELTTSVSISNLSSVLAQDVVDQVVGHLLIQNTRSSSKDGCVYRNENGLRCAAGCLISNSEYKPVFELNLWSQLVGTYGIPYTHSSLIDRLQEVHDQYDVQNWDTLLRKVVKDGRLRYLVDTWNDYYETDLFLQPDHF